MPDPIPTAPIVSSPSSPPPVAPPLQTQQAAPAPVVPAVSVPVATPVVAAPASAVTSAPARPARKAGKILLSFALVVIVIAGGGYGWTIVQSNAPSKTAQAFISAVGGTQIDTAYGLTTSEFQKKYSKDEFQIGLDESHVTGKVSFTKVTDKQRTDDRATVRGTIQHDGSGTGSLEVALMKENNAWRVKNFSIKAGTAIALDSAAELTKTQAYSDTGLGFSSRYLRGWEKMDLPEIYGQGVAFKSPVENSEDSYRENVVVTVDSLVDGSTLSQLTDFFINYHQEETPGFSLQDSKAVKIGGEDGHQITFTSESEDIQVRQIQSWVIKNNKAYTFLYTAIGESYDKFMSGFDSVVKHFAFL